MPIQTLINLFLKIFLMISFGYLLKKKQIITTELQKGLTNLLLKAILPISILSSANTEFTKTASKNILLAVVIGAGYYTVSLILLTMLSKIIPLRYKAKKVFVTMIVFANTAFLGFPLITELYGTDALIYAVIYNIFYQLFFFTYGISLLSGNIGFQFKSIYTNVVTIASFISIIIFISPFRFPESVASSLSSIGSMTVPISMMIIGCSLADIKIMHVMKDAYSYLVSALRLIVLPFILLIILKILKLPFEISAVCVVMTALPSGSLNAIYAEQYDCEP